MDKHKGYPTPDQQETINNWDVHRDIPRHVHRDVFKDVKWDVSKDIDLGY